MNNFFALSKKIPLEKYSSLFLILTVFFLPISSSLKSIFLALTLLSLALTLKDQDYLPRIYKQPWCIISISFFSLALFACLWSPATLQEKFFVLEKYSKLLYLPLLVLICIKPKVRTYSSHAFLLALLLTCALAILKFYNLLSLDINPEHVFRNRIMTGLMVAYASYLSLWLASKSASKSGTFAYFLLATIYSYHVLFVNGSRTGYVIYFLLMILLVLQLYNSKQSLLGLAIVSSVFLFSYYHSEEMQDRLGAIALQVQNYQHHQAIQGSIDMRLSFHNFAKSLFLKHPLIGNGTAGFMDNFYQIDPVPIWGRHLLEPHSQYWLVAAEFGFLGLIILGLFFYTLFQASINLATLRVPALGLLVCFIIGNLSDSLLFYSGSGYFFLLAMAICLGDHRDFSAIAR